METEPRKDSDDVVRDVLSGFNAEEIIDDPDDEIPDEKNPLPAATPDSPNPI